VPNWLVTVTAAVIPARTLKSATPRVTVSLPPLVLTVTGVLGAVASTRIWLPPLPAYRVRPVRALYEAAP
jgi:hypothetical protein